MDHISPDDIAYLVRREREREERERLWWRSWKFAVTAVALTILGLSIASTWYAEPLALVLK